MVRQVTIRPSALMHLIAIALASAGSPAVAQNLPIRTAQDCIRHASELADAAEEKQLSDEKLDHIEDLVVRMEAYCDANQLDEARALARDIRAEIDAE
jgi:hypothetical protein